VEFRILGPLGVAEDGHPISLGSGRQRALLAVLLLHRNQVVTADRLIDELWGERPAGTAANLVQVYVSRLRKALGKERLVTSGSGYVLRVDEGALDLDEFERLAEQGRRALEDGEAARAAELLQEALALWRGPALPDVVFEGIAQAEVGRLEELRLAVLEERIEAELGCGHHAVLVGELEALVAEHPFRERLRGQLMLALYRSGRQAEALELYRQTRRTFVEELGLEPGPALQELEHAMLAQDPFLDAPAATAAPKATRPIKPSLPVPPTPLIGREHELEEVVSLMRGGCRLLTLTGTGGTGKTRLALQAATELAQDFPDGAWWVSLARVRDAGRVVPAIADALGVSEPLDRYLPERRALLLLDNFEHVLDAAPAVSSLLSASPGLRVLATSREPLRLAAECEYPVLPLTRDEAVSLFHERARAVQPGFAADGVVAEICERLDFLPLAIELAAARVRLLSPELLLRQLEQRFALLTSGARDAPERQQSLHATLDWSYALLADAERALFARLSVFVGGFTIGAAQGVCDDGDVLTDLTSLVEKSLVRRTGDQAGEPRFVLLETIREYAAERLGEGADADQVRERHARWYAALAEELRQEWASEQGSRDRMLAIFAVERGNLHAALEWFSRAGDTGAQLRLASCSWIWFPGSASEGRRVLAELLEQTAAAPSADRLRALITASNLALDQDVEESLRLAEDALALARRVRDDAQQLDALEAIQRSANALDEARAREAALEGERLGRRLGRWTSVATFIINRAALDATYGDYAAAKLGLTEALSIAFEHGGSNALRAVVMLGLAQISCEEARLADAVDNLAGALRLLDPELDAYEWIFIDGIAGFSSIAVAAGDHRMAARLSAAAEAWRDRDGIALLPWEQSVHERTIEAVRAALPPGEILAARAAGAKLSVPEAVAEALSWIEESRLSVNAGENTGKAPSASTRSVNHAPGVDSPENVA
jgi:predicted ATPase/DNA-binding SARP family transcriptional activator